MTYLLLPFSIIRLLRVLFVKFYHQDSTLLHPDLFQKAVEYEQNHRDGRTYTWTQGETLLELLARKDQVIADHHKAMAREAQKKPDRPLVEALEAVLDEEDETLPCLACHL